MEVKNKDTSIPKDLSRIRMVLLSQKKTPIATKIIRELGRVSKERYM